MKVILVNGSPHQNGCTATALNEAGKVLEQEGIELCRFWIGTKPIAGCIDCRHCAKGEGCVFQNDVVSQFQELAGSADGFLFGSPVYYGAVAGPMVSFMNRAFFSANRGGHNPFSGKPAAAVVSARRAGTTAALDQLQKYFTLTQMPIISSQYWNMVHGNTPEEVAQDLEGLQIMRTLGRNMAWYLKCRQAAEQAGITPPQQEPRIATNFIR